MGMKHIVSRGRKRALAQKAVKGAKGQVTRTPAPITKAAPFPGSRASLSELQPIITAPFEVSGATDDDEVMGDIDRETRLEETIEVVDDEIDG